MIAEYIIKNEKNLYEMEIKDGFPVSAMIDGTLREFVRETILKNTEFA
jgi:hypothetical protein